MPALYLVGLRIGLPENRCALFGPMRLPTSRKGEGRDDP
jgi:hypothetical protein